MEVSKKQINQGYNSMATMSCLSQHENPDWATMTFELSSVSVPYIITDLSMHSFDHGHPSKTIQNLTNLSQLSPHPPHLMSAALNAPFY